MTARPWDSISLHEQIKEVQREVEMRRNFYPRMIERRSMTAAVALRRQHRMLAVLDTLERLQEQLKREPANE